MSYRACVRLESIPYTCIYAFMLMRSRTHVRIDAVYAWYTCAMYVPFVGACYRHTRTALINTIQMAKLYLVIPCANSPCSTIPRRKCIPAPAVACIDESLENRLKNHSGSEMNSQKRHDSCLITFYAARNLVNRLERVRSLISSNVFKMLCDAQSEGNATEEALPLRGATR